VIERYGLPESRVRPIHLGLDHTTFTPGETMREPFLVYPARAWPHKNHERLFGAIHDSGRQFLSAEMVADFVDGNGVSREAFLSTFDSPAVRSRMRQAEADQRQMGITSVPTLVVDGKYRIGMEVGRKTALDVVDHLIAQERSTNTDG